MSVLDGKAEVWHSEVFNGSSSAGIRYTEVIWMKEMMKQILSAVLRLTSSVTAALFVVRESPPGLLSFLFGDLSFYRWVCAISVGIARKELQTCRITYIITHRYLVEIMNTHAKGEVAVL